jgi:hypothetical protein
MSGHLWVVPVAGDDEEEFPVEPVDPVVPAVSNTSVSAFVVAAFVFACAGVLAALATAAPPNPSPNAPETTAAAMSGFFIRMLHLLLSDRRCGRPRGDLPRGHSTERSWSRPVGASSRA